MNAIANRRIAAEEGADFYPTPEWATRALLASESFLGNTWEPACGNGAMAEVLFHNGLAPCASDLNDHGYGVSGVDFLNCDISDPCGPTLGHRPANIITNPPFNLAEPFLDRALDLATHKVALLLRLAFLESAGRAGRIFLNPDRRPARVWVFSERITFYPAGVQTGGSGTTAYAWFVWDKLHRRETELRWFPPGHKPNGRDRK